MKFEDAKNSIHKVHVIDREIEETVDTIKKLQASLTDKRFIRLTLKRQFDFIKTQPEADELQVLSDLYPEIENGRQLQIINYITKFMNNKEIAAKVFLSDKTVKFHKTRIFNILDCMGEKGLLKIHQERTLAKERAIASKQNAAS